MHVQVPPESDRAGPVETARQGKPARLELASAYTQSPVLPDCGPWPSQQADRRPPLLACPARSPVARPFYLKYHSRRFGHGLFCLSFWLEVARSCNSPVFIVCDDPVCEAQIRSHVTAGDRATKLISSDRRSYADIIKKSFDGRWVNTAHALLTPLIDAAARGFDEFWNIDADDLIYFARPADVALYLEQVAMHANAAHIDMLSQDFVTSRRPGQKSWSFGITYIQTHDRYSSLDALMSHMAAEPWQAACRDPGQKSFNLDRFFSHLSSVQGLYVFRNFNINHLYYAHYCYPEIRFDPSNLLYFVRVARGDVVTLPLSRMTATPIAFPIDPEQTAVLDCGVSLSESFALFLRYTSCMLALYPFASTYQTSPQMA